VATAVSELRRDDSAEAVPIELFREALSRVPAAVTIVTTSADGRAHGTTVSSFCSLSAEPPLILVALDRRSELLVLLGRSGRFAVNLLATGQEEIGLVCATKAEDKLDRVSWRLDCGLPRIDGGAAFIACEVESFVPGGDHVIVTGLVTGCDLAEGQPLVYHRRSFHAIPAGGD
jgi:flavin reductase (DIM6/NTAB) family NADH-FMN oxidoreductase RutF